MAADNIPKMLLAYKVNKIVVLKNCVDNRKYGFSFQVTQLKHCLYDRCKLVMYPLIQLMERFYID
jgi:hypothetical protein